MDNQDQNTNTSPPESPQTIPEPPSEPYQMTGQPQLPDIPPLPQVPTLQDAVPPIYSPPEQNYPSGQSYWQGQGYQSGQSTQPQQGYQTGQSYPPGQSYQPSPGYPPPGQGMNIPAQNFGSSPGSSGVTPDSYPGKGQSLASMIIGICSLVIGGVWLALPIVGLILGIIGRKKAVQAGAPTGLSTAGIIMSSIAIALGLFTTICTIVGCTALMAGTPYWTDFYYY